MRPVYFLQVFLLALTVGSTPVVFEYQAIMRPRLFRSNMLLEYKLNDIVVVECNIEHHEPNTTYRWFKNGFPMYSTNRRIRFIDNKLVIKRLLKIDQGVYYCQTTTGYTSPTLTLQLYNNQIPIDIESKRGAPETQLAFETSSDLLDLKQEGTSAVLECRTRSNQQRPHILWYKNGELIGDDDPRFHLNRSSMSLSIHKVRFNDSGQYKCQVFNQHGELSKNFSLAVTEKSVNNITGWFDDSVVIDCDIGQANRHNVNNVKWYTDMIFNSDFDKPKLRLEDQVYFQIITSANMTINPSNGSLLIRRLDFLNTGVYFCTVNDSTMSRNRISLTLTLPRQFNPSWHESLLNASHPAILILIFIMLVGLLMLLVFCCFNAFWLCKNNRDLDKAYFVRQNPSNRQSRSVHMRRPGLSNKRLSFHEASLCRDAYFGRTRRYSSVVTTMPSLHNTAFANGTYESEISMNRDMTYQQIPRSKSNYQMFNIQPNERTLPQIIV